METLVFNYKTPNLCFTPIKAEVIADTESYLSSNLHIALLFVFHEPRHEPFLFAMKKTERPLSVRAIKWHTAAVMMQ